jgi:hypothetical protein
MKDEEYWKALSIKRRYENKALKGRLKEVSDSRDVWKEKAMRSQKESKALLNQIAMIKKNLNQIKNL